MSAAVLSADHPVPFTDERVHCPDYLRPVRSRSLCRGYPEVVGYRQKQTPGVCRFYVSIGIYREFNHTQKLVTILFLCIFAVQLQNCIKNMKDQYIYRSISDEVKEAFRYFSVITITGPRQSGKTTLIRNLFPQLQWKKR